MAEELRIVLRNVGKINPLSIDDYISAGGYKSLEKARSMSQKELIEEVKKSGLRGRGGAGFNTGQSGSLHTTSSPIRSTSYVTPTKGNREPIRTESSWKMIPTAYLKVWPSADTPSAPTRVISIAGENTRKLSKF